ncbi:MAG: hypothetical protein II285_02415, partial [Flavobacteriales bacterium]|nr:hypothetical protein [Flavobacteriales bacterium]
MAILIALDYGTRRVGPVSSSICPFFLQFRSSLSADLPTALQMPSHTAVFLLRSLRQMLCMFS